MLRICISGRSFSGKTTLGELLAKELNIVHINSTYKKDFRSNEALFGALGSDPKHTSYAKNFDKQVVEKARNNDCVVTTWLGAWLIKDATMRVWLDAGFDERAKRCARIKSCSISEAKKYVDRKDGLSAQHFKSVYNIDIIDHSIFDIEMNTQNMTEQECLAMISMLALSRSDKRF